MCVCVCVIDNFNRAYYGRGAGVPSGDQILEGYNFRLQEIVFPKNGLALDFVAKALYEEAKYQEKVMSTPHLREERVKQVEDSRKRKYVVC